MGDDEGALEPTGLPRPPARREQSGDGARAEQTTADIVDVLAEIPDMREMAGRLVVMHFIGEEVGATLILPEHPNPKYCLFHLVLACREISDGLTLLVRAVEFVAGPTLTVARLRRLVSPVHGHLEPAAERQIEDILSGLRPPSLARIFHVVSGHSVMSSSFRVTDAWDAFSTLLDHNAAPDRPSPHLIFVAMLVQAIQTREKVEGLPPEEAWRLKQLREWLGGQTERLRADGAPNHAEYLDRVRDRWEMVAPRTDKPIYLIIQLDPIADLSEGELMCRLSHWRQIHPLEWRPEPGEDSIVPLREVSQHVGALVQSAESGWAYQLDDSLVLEFVLPLEMINLDLDQWTRDPPDAQDPTPLGAEYEVLVRSNERLRALDMHRAWRQRWHVLTDASRSTTFWAGKTASPDLGWMRDRILSDSDVVACVLSSPPDREPGRTELRMALRAGLPVVLWHRSGVEFAELRTVLRDVLGRPDLRSLPKDIRRLRGGIPPADDESQRRPLDVTLLWDDPNHFLDEAESLRPPKRSGW